MNTPLRKFLTGLTIPQEYCCIDTINFVRPLHIWLTNLFAGSAIDVTESHLFLGYKPLIIGIVFKKDSQEYKAAKPSAEIALRLSEASPPDGTSLALLKLAFIREMVMGDGHVILLYEGKRGTHHFLNICHQILNRLREKLRRKSPGNVALPGNLFDQVRIAYSIPRVISIVTVSDGVLMNMFPTDLHGPISDNYYASSLREGGYANQQIQDIKRLVISEVSPEWFQKAYELGKNHMQPLRDETSFILHQTRSREFNFPLPTGVIRYRELSEIDFIDKGIHKVHFYKIHSHVTVDENKPALAHIHQYYLQWRLNNGISTPWLKR